MMYLQPLSSFKPVITYNIWRSISKRSHYITHQKKKKKSCVILNYFCFVFAWIRLCMSGSEMDGCLFMIQCHVVIWFHVLSVWNCLVKNSDRAIEPVSLKYVVCFLLTLMKETEGCLCLGRGCFLLWWQAYLHLWRMFLNGISCAVELCWCLKQSGTCPFSAKCMVKYIIIPENHIQIPVARSIEERNAQGS